MMPCGFFKMINPVNHALNAELARRYKVEPYVIVADVYGVAPHRGRGGWTWYTGAAGWAYRAGLEAILGLKRRASNFIWRLRCQRHGPVFRWNTSMKMSASRCNFQRRKTGAPTEAKPNIIDLTKVKQSQVIKIVFRREGFRISASVLNSIEGCHSADEKAHHHEHGTNAKKKQNWKEKPRHASGRSKKPLFANLNHVPVPVFLK